MNPTNKISTPLIKKKISQNKLNFEEIKNKDELMKQNDLLLRKFENDVEQIKEAQKKIFEISNLIQTFSEKIVDQDITTEQSIINQFILYYSSIFYK